MSKYKKGGVAVALVAVIAVVLTFMSHLKVNDAAFAEHLIGLGGGPEMLQILIDDETVPASVKDTLRAITKDPAMAKSLHAAAATRATDALFYLRIKTLGLLVLTLGLAFTAGALFRYEPKPPEVIPEVLEPGLRLRLMREALLLTQRGLAKHLPVSQSTLVRMELGQSKIGKEIWAIMRSLKPTIIPYVKPDEADQTLPAKAAPVPSKKSQA